MAELLKPDICVIGAGSGGLSVAAAAAAFGVSVALIEKGKMGGDCLNTGCVPSKALIAAAKRVADVNGAAAFGVMTQSPKVKFPDVQRHVENVIAAIAPNDSKERFTALGVRIVAGAARFKNAGTVVVDDEDIEVQARRFVIATGSSPAIPPINGLADVPYLTNETIFDLNICPKHLIVIGAGPIGLELAQAFRRLGAEVTVLEAASPLANDDAECADVVLEQIADDGVTLRAGIEIKQIKRARGKVQVVVAGPTGEDTIEGSHLLLAAGRAPNIDDLDLDAAGIKREPSGIVVNRRLKTTNRRVYAIGDAAGGPQFTHVANYHAGLVVGTPCFGCQSRSTTTRCPSSLTPTPSSPGRSHRSRARRRRYAIRVLRWPFDENDRAQAERETKGYIKVITTSAAAFWAQQSSARGRRADRNLGAGYRATLNIRCLSEPCYPIRHSPRSESEQG